MLSPMLFAPGRRRRPDRHRSGAGADPVGASLAADALGPPLAADAEADEVIVWVDPDLSGVRQRLADELGSGFRVQSGPVPDCGVVLVADPSAAVIAGLRRMHPGPGLIAVIPYEPSGGSEVALLLDAGADDVALAANPLELSLRVRAIARRL